MSLCFFFQRVERGIESLRTLCHRAVGAVKILAGAPALNGSEIGPAFALVANDGMTKRLLKTCPNIGLKNIAHSTILASTAGYAERRRPWEQIKYEPFREDTERLDNTEKRPYIRARKPAVRPLRHV